MSWSSWNSPSAVKVTSSCDGWHPTIIGISAPHLCAYHVVPVCSVATLACTLTLGHELRRSTTSCKSRAMKTCLRLVMPRISRR